MASEQMDPGFSPSNKRAQSGENKHRRRSGVRVACNPCRNKKTRCDGRRPVCGWCASHSGTKCMYDTESASESRSAALKRENEILRGNLQQAERLLRDLTTLSDEESVQLLKRMRFTGNNMGDLYPTPAYNYAHSFVSAENSSGDNSDIHAGPDGVATRPQQSLNSRLSPAMNVLKPSGIPNVQAVGLGAPGFGVVVNRVETGHFPNQDQRAGRRQQANPPWSQHNETSFISTK